MNPAVPQAAEDAHPKFSALVFAHPHSKHIPNAIHLNADGDIDGFLHNLPFTTDVEVNCIIACVDGLTGFPNAIEAVFPQTEIQQCSHLQGHQEVDGRFKAGLCRSG